MIWVCDVRDQDIGFCDFLSDQVIYLETNRLKCLPRYNGTARF
ncbi:hypothetical protein HMPREF0185_01526 [Brevundimonas diminuta 470-4]|nr:hypothetical protein HMPREF0185_01526 [Brevundimonas diminuta 470-4]